MFSRAQERYLKREPSTNMQTSRCGGTGTFQVCGFYSGAGSTKGSNSWSYHVSSPDHGLVIVHIPYAQNLCCIVPTPPPSDREMKPDCTLFFDFISITLKRKFDPIILHTHSCRKISALDLPPALATSPCSSTRSLRSCTGSGYPPGCPPWCGLVRFALCAFPN
jgi:hypothetical protein